MLVINQLILCDYEHRSETSKRSLDQLKPAMKFDRNTYYNTAIRDKNFLQAIIQFLNESETGEIKKMTIVYRCKGCYQEMRTHVTLSVTTTSELVLGLLVNCVYFSSNGNLLYNSYL